MVSWTLRTDAAALAQWDRQLLAFDDYSIYQTIAWGEHRRALGWTPCRWIASEGGTTVAMAQGLLRRYPGGAGIVWLPGGPVGSIEAWASLALAIRRSTGLTFPYCRINSFRACLDAEQRCLAAAHWRQPRSRLTSGASLLYDVGRPEDTRLAACSRNWRHNLKRSHKGGFTLAPWADPDVDEMRAVYAEMEDYKNLPPQHSARNLQALYAHLGKHLITWSCRDGSGRLLAFRACAVLQDKAWDMLAATAVAGRKSYASYATFWALTEECHRRGIRHYDLSGVDATANRGVYDFKQGTGAAPLDYLGEWEFASPRALAAPVNWLISRRHGDM